MITITVKKEDGKYVGLKSEGHASQGFGVNGKNILCAAISTLTQSLCFFLEEKNLVLRVIIDNSKGILDFTNTPNEVSQACYEMTLNTINILKNQYPEEINVY
jgi:uncharacterized protein YsxB (DUF464 family)